MRISDMGYKRFFGRDNYWTIKVQLGLVQKLGHSHILRFSKKWGRGTMDYYIGYRLK
jgi:hypothetical protein